MKELLLRNIRTQMKHHVWLANSNKWTSTWWNQWSNLVSTYHRILKHHFGKTEDEDGYRI